MSLVSATRAFDSGLTLMSLEEAIRSTLKWFKAAPKQDWPAGLALGEKASS
jgi:hypothetical protein